MKMSFNRTNRDLARMDGKKFGLDQIMTTLCFLIMTTVVILPVVMIIYNTFWDGTKLDLEMFARVILREENLTAMKNTVIIAIFATLFATIVGVLFAWLLGRSDIPMKGLMRWLFSIPFMIPPFLAAMAWDMMFSGRGGYINCLLMNIFNLRDAPFNINTVAGIIVIEVIYYFPFVYMQVVSALERMNPTLEESARIAGAKQWYVIRKITLPLTIPAISSGTLLVFSIIFLVLVVLTPLVIILLVSFLRAYGLPFEFKNFSFVNYKKILVGTRRLPTRSKTACSWASVQASSACSWA